MPRSTSCAALAGALALLASLTAAPATAEVQWFVDATFADGGTVKGSFSLGPTDYYAQDIDLTTSANGAFDGFHFGGPTDIAVGLPNHSTIIAFGPTYSGEQLVLYAQNTLDVAGPNTLLATSYECFDSYDCPTAPAGDIRFLAGPSALSLTAAPEPGTWTLMLVGAAAVGAAARRRRNYGDTALDPRRRFGMRSQGHLLYVAPNPVAQ